MRNRGELHYLAKLTDNDVSIIRQLVEERNKHLSEARKLTNEKIGEKFGVGVKCIEKIIYQNAWWHVS